MNRIFIALALALLSTASLAKEEPPKSPTANFERAVTFNGMVCEIKAQIFFTTQSDPSGNSKAAYSELLKCITNARNEGVNAYKKLASSKYRSSVKNVGKKLLLSYLTYLDFMPSASSFEAIESSQSKSTFNSALNEYQMDIDGI